MQEKDIFSISTKRIGNQFTVSTTKYNKATDTVINKEVSFLIPEELDLKKLGEKYRKLQSSPSSGLQLSSNALSSPHQNYNALKERVKLKLKSKHEEKSPGNTVCNKERVEGIDTTYVISNCPLALKDEESLSAVSTANSYYLNEFPEIQQEIGLTGINEEEKGENLNTTYVGSNCDQTTTEENLNTTYVGSNCVISKREKKTLSQKKQREAKRREQKFLYAEKFCVPEGMENEPAADIRFMSYLYRKIEQFCGGDKSKCVHLYSGFLKALFKSFPGGYIAIRDRLVKTGKITVDPSYSFGGPNPYSMTYFIAPEWQKKPTKIVTIKRTKKLRLIKEHKVDEEELEATINRYNPDLIKYLESVLRRVKVNPATLERLMDAPNNGDNITVERKELTHHHAQLHTLKANARESMIKKFKKSDRIYHHIIATPSNFRRIYEIDGKPLETFDLKSAHPFLALTFYNEIPNSINEKRKIYHDLRDDIYERCANELHITRKKVKDMFVTLLAGVGSKTCKYQVDNKVTRWFSNRYPLLFNLLSNKPDIALQLQNLEAKIIVETLGEEARQKGLILVTEHDGGSSTAEDIDRVIETAMKATKRITGLYPIITKKGKEDSLIKYPAEEIF